MKPLLIVLNSISGLYATGAMTGALFSEFFLRSNPKWPLVYIATAIVVIAVVNLLSRYSKISQVLRSKRSTAVTLKAQNSA
jgi:hypothetical protein